MSAADGGSGNAARALHEGETTTQQQPFDLDAAKDKVTGRDRARVHLRVVSEAESETSRQHEGRRTRPGIRSRTISIKRLSKRELERGRMMYPETEYERPITRGDCLHGPHAERPCPFVRCKHHLYLDVNEHTGSIKVNFPDLEVWELRETCTLDVADRGGITLEEVGEIMNLTRERVRQLETRAIARLRALGELGDIGEWIDVDRNSTSARGRAAWGSCRSEDGADTSSGGLSTEHAIGSDVSGIVAEESAFAAAEDIAAIGSYLGL